MDGRSKKRSRDVSTRARALRSIGVRISDPNLSVGIHEASIIDVHFISRTPCPYISFHHCSYLVAMRLFSQLISHGESVIDWSVEHARTYMPYSAE